MNKEREGNTMRYEGHRRLYRSRDGIVWGVCQGVADWMEIPVGIIRTICVVSLILSGVFPMALIYAVAALVLPPEPVYRTRAYGSSEQRWERRFYQ